MPEAPHLEKAVLQEIHWDQDNQVVVDEDGKRITVQFNPETLKLAFSNQFANNDDSGGAAIQFVSKGTTKLNMDLVLDVTAPAAADSRADSQNARVKDVRKLSSEIGYFMRGQPDPDSSEPKQKVPGVRFQWGSFLFDGVMESINETLEFFSADGRPLRATVSLSLVKQDVDVRPAELGSGSGPAANPATATRPQQPARQGEPLQKMAGRSGKSADWQQMALANGIENPRQIQAGALIDVGAKIGASTRRF